MFIINPDQYSLPSYRIGPFTTKDLTHNHQIYCNQRLNIEFLDDYFKNRFGKNYYYTVNGREAINISLQSYNLKKTDLVTIITTSQNYYISSCVTKEIEKFCQWNREIIPETKLIFVNHEFGYVYPNMDRLVSLGIPIIEDCCTTFFSQDKVGRVGNYGDFAIYSFPKFFPIQIGGLLVKNSTSRVTNKPSIDKETELYVKKVVIYHLELLNELLNKREKIYYYALQTFRTLGFTERFFNDKLTIPSVLMLNNNMIINDLPALKVHLWNHGIQSSIFYGEDAFFLPNHQNLETSDVDYFFEVIKRQI